MELRFSNLELEAGCDEAGRGCLAGPVVGAAVILPQNFKNLDLDDSKKLSEKKRESLREIIENESICWSVAFVSNQEIDQINILQASVLAMQNALSSLNKTPEYIVVDGNYFKSYRDIPYTSIVKGDEKYMNIAAASILAKTHRDTFMKEKHEEYSVYGWDKNKGYPTSKHRLAIAQNGTSPLHRKSFRLLPN